MLFSWLYRLQSSPAKIPIKNKGYLDKGWKVAAAKAGQKPKKGRINTNNIINKTS